MSMNNWINIGTMGHANHGKSTLVGYLLYKLNEVSESDLRKTTEDAIRSGRKDMRFAFIMDHVPMARARGMSMIREYMGVEIGSKHMMLVDNPGKNIFFVNAAKGISQIDVGLLTVDASGIEYTQSIREPEMVGDRWEVGSARLHAIIAKRNGVAPIIVAVTKMDKIEYSKEKYFEVVDEMRGMLTSPEVGFDESDLIFIPTAILVKEASDQNVFASSNKMTWYEGPTLIQILENLHLPRRDVDLPLRLQIERVYRGVKGQTAVVTGLVLTGKVEIGSSVVISPGNVQGKVRSIKMRDQSATRNRAERWEPEEVVESGAIVGIGLGFSDKSFADKIHPGDVLSSPENRPIIAQEFEAEISVYLPMVRLEAEKVHSGIQIGAYKGGFRLEKIFHKQNISTGKAMLPLNQMDFLDMGDLARVRIKLDKPAAIDIFEFNPRIGSFLLYNAYGLITAGGKIVQSQIG